MLNAETFVTALDFYLAAHRRWGLSLVWF